MWRAVVVGVGTGCRHDDGLGPAVAVSIAGLQLPGVEVVTSPGDLTQLLDLWHDADLAVVIDAVLRTPSRPGRIEWIDAESADEAVPTTSCHALGVFEAVRLGRSLGRLPGRLVIVAVDAACLDLGIGLSAAVAAAVPSAVVTVVAELARSRLSVEG
ncbi:hydrogenase maturation protease [Nocardia carnea]|uniref:hydrogenase maturation protease n=1 Tax=Nocardia carnea TaxID=37328 RepID=UPI00245758DC|nr:hydrogenase maturation protease [Nocardia carnea]